MVLHAYCWFFKGLHRGNDMRILQRGRRTKLDREITALNPVRTARHRTITLADRKARWRELYEAAVEINFEQCVGQKPGTTEAHWIELSPLGWANQQGVPAALVQQWELERRRT
jgi:hypothetical protein